MTIIVATPTMASAANIPPIVIMSGTPFEATGVVDVAGAWVGAIWAPTGVAVEVGGVYGFTEISQNDVPRPPCGDVAVNVG